MKDKNSEICVFGSAITGWTEDISSIGVIKKAISLPNIKYDHLYTFSFV
jgi:hypothetical protein